MVEGQGDAPVQARDRAGDAKVLELLAFQKAEHFVAPVVGLDERRVRLDVVNQPLLLRAQPEPVIRFRKLDDLAVGRVKSAVGAPVLVGEKSLLLGRIPTLVGLRVELAGRVQPGEDGLDEFLMARFGGADEIVVRNAELLPERTKTFREFVAERLRGFALRRGGLLDLLSVLDRKSVV